ncbi:MAG: hypothetical protein AAF456_17695 [Planctomycetota bacterium]
MKYVPWIVIMLLILAHQDYWQWSRDEMLFGFLPYPLAYHMALSVVTAGAWIIVVQFFWPDDADVADDSSEGGAQ